MGTEDIFGPAPGEDAAAGGSSELRQRRFGEGTGAGQPASPSSSEDFPSSQFLTPFSPESGESETSTAASDARSSTPSSMSTTFSDPADLLDYYDDGEFWDDLEDASVYDLLGTNWVDHAKRTMRKVSKKVKKLNDDLDRTRHDLDRRTKEARVRAVRELVTKVETHWVKLETKLRNPTITRTRDKVAFFFGVTDLWFTAALAGMYPRAMPTWYTLKAFVLLAVRWGVYRRKRWHYFLADFCYLVNTLLMVFLHIAPHSRTLFHIVFACAHGPLAWAIVTWRNSMVFHSLDKMTSVFIHLAPPITLTTLRWLDTTASTAASPYFGGRGQPPRSTSDPSSMTIWQGVMGLTLVYAVWQAGYYVFILRRRRAKVYEQGYLTSYTMLAHGTGAIARVAGSLGDKMRLPMFMGLQYLYSVLTVVPAVLLMRNKWTELAYLAVILSASIWNGATFYIHVFSARYLRDLEKLEREFKLQWAAMTPKAQSPADPADAADAECPTAAGQPHLGIAVEHGEVGHKHAEESSNSKIAGPEQAAAA